MRIGFSWQGTESAPDPAGINARPLQDLPAGNGYGGSASDVYRYDGRRSPAGTLFLHSRNYCHSCKLTFQTRTVVSAPPETRNLPSADQARASTPDE